MRHQVEEVGVRLKEVTVFSGGRRKRGAGGEFVAKHAARVPGDLFGAVQVLGAETRDEGEPGHGELRLYITADGLVGGVLVQYYGNELVGVGRVPSVVQRVVLQGLSVRGKMIHRVFGTAAEFQYLLRDLNFDAILKAEHVWKRGDVYVLVHVGDPIGGQVGVGVRFR
ncbi:MAG: hypothetical protein BWY96_03146 [Spirochaetes bacterium ADurb.BinA120]|nr:MAG: hypothetical protein BWY96_03146 [Spirochaetes bacterium ADurb.BinA120]